jgi:prophage regulatory protein
MQQTAIPETGLLRIYQICGDKRRGVQPLIAISRSAWWAGVKVGRYPKGRKLSAGVTVWAAEDIRALIANPSSAETE